MTLWRRTCAAPRGCGRHAARRPRAPRTRSCRSLGSEVSEEHWPVALMVGEGREHLHRLPSLSLLLQIERRVHHRVVQPKPTPGRNSKRRGVRELERSGAQERVKLVLERQTAPGLALPCASNSFLVFVWAGQPDDVRVSRFAKVNSRTASGEGARGRPLP